MAHLTLEFVEVSAEVLAATKVINAFSVDLIENSTHSELGHSVILALI